MENESEILQEANQIIVFLSEEFKEKRVDLESSKAIIKQQKIDYNAEIKEYYNMIKAIVSQEVEIEEIEKSINKLRYKQKMTILMINNDFVRHFNDFSSRVSPDVIESLMEFFGYNQTPYNLLKKMIKDQFELKCVMEYSEQLNSFLQSILTENVKNNNKTVLHTDLLSELKEKQEESNTSVSEAISQTKEKIMSVKSKYQNNLQYPFDHIYEYVISVYLLAERNTEKEAILNKIESFNYKKNIVFLGLKSLESEIVKNDSSYRVISKYLKSINSLFERYKILKEIPANEKNKLDRLKDFLIQLKNFKKLNVNNLRKYDNMNSLTLKSEYSEDYTELGPNADDVNLNSLLNSTSMNKIKEDSKSQKVDETINEIIHGLTASKAKENKIKNSKKIKNKKLQLSNVNSDLDVTDNQKLSIKKVSTKLKSWNKDLKQMKTKNKFNFSIQKYPSTTSPRNTGVKSSIINANLVSQFSNTHSSFRIDHKVKKNATSCNNVNSIEKVKSQTSLMNSDLRNLPLRKLSEDIPRLSKQKEMIQKKEIADRLQSPTNYHDKIHSAASLLRTNTFSPSTSQSNYILIEAGNMIFPSNNDHLESVSDEWIISPLNKIPIRTSKLISEKPIRAKEMKSMPDFFNLKIDKPIINSTGCCVSCV